MAKGPCRGSSIYGDCAHRAGWAFRRLPKIPIGDRVDIDLKFASGASASFRLPVVANPHTSGEGDRASDQSHQH
jgi:hypothetical protein